MSVMSKSEKELLAQIVSEHVRKILPKASGVIVNVDENQITVTLPFDDGVVVTFKELRQLGHALGTDLIDLTIGNPSNWSEVTPGPKEYPTIIIRGIRTDLIVRR